MLTEEEQHGSLMLVNVKAVILIKSSFTSRSNVSTLYYIIFQKLLALIT